jgi:hypothetical protein
MGASALLATTSCPDMILGTSACGGRVSSQLRRSDQPTSLVTIFGEGHRLRVAECVSCATGGRCCPGVRAPRRPAR